MKILLLNDSYFGNHFEGRNIEVLRVGPGKSNDIIIDPLEDDISNILIMTGFKPDVALQVDSIDKRVFFKGVDKLDIPLAFYAIDGPINDFWQKYYAHQFDLVYVDQYDTYKSLQTAGVSWAKWLPLAADTDIFNTTSEENVRDLDIVFVGTLDSKLRPKRSAIIHRLKKVANVTVVDGDGKRAVSPAEVAEYYRRAKLVLNELLFDGINLRTFEAMASGALLLTEADRGEGRIFTDSENIAVFNASNLEQVVTDLLADEDKIKNIAETGLKLINSSHTISNRLDVVLKDLKALSIRSDRSSVESKVETAWGVWQASMKWQSLAAEREVASRILNENLFMLDEYRKSILLQSVGDNLSAFNLLKRNMNNGHTNPKTRAAIVSLALQNNDVTNAKELLQHDSENIADLHVEVGNLLMGLGDDFTPGFNRTNSPSISWTAFEHFNRAYQLNEDSITAISGLDRILTAHNSSEFTVNMWQRFHSRNPKNINVQKTFISRAKSGYYMPGIVEVKGRSTVPLVKDSRRSGDRTQSNGPSAGSWT
jgi:Glycosyl transferases group 1/DUF based on E. rectale Gene description (DUF3880)